MKAQYFPKEQKRRLQYRQTQMLLYNQKQYCKQTIPSRTISSTRNYIAILTNKSKFHMEKRR